MKETVTKVCAECGATFEASFCQARYCSAKCRRRAGNVRYIKAHPDYKRKSRAKETVSCVCKRCGKVFVTTRSDKKFCSLACQRATNRDKWGWQSWTPEKMREYRKKMKAKETPEQREKRLARKRETERMRRMSIANGNVTVVKKQVKVVCKMCGKVFFGAKDRIYCSMECRKNEIEKRKKDRYAERERRKAESEKRKAIMKKLVADKIEEQKRRHREKLLADIFAPIGDDEPLSNYIGRMA